LLTCFEESIHRNTKSVHAWRTHAPYTPCILRHTLLYTCVRTAATGLCVAGVQDIDSLRLSTCGGNILMGTGSCATAPTRCITPYGGNDGAVTAWTGQTVHRREPATSPVSLTRRSGGEGRECVPHDCGAVHMCACHGLEQGGRTRGVAANPKQSRLTHQYPLPACEWLL
jgi:hypothetical protein